MQTTITTTAILATPLLSPKLTSQPFRFLDKEDGMVFIQIEPADPDKDAYREYCGPLGAGETLYNVPAEFRATYERWLAVAEFEADEEREAERDYDDYCAQRAWDFNSTRGL